MRGWLLRGCAIVLAAVLPLLLGAPAAMAMLLLMPAAVECCREADERLACGGAIAALYLACWITLPEALSGVALLWCAAGAVMLAVRDGHAVKRGAAWVGICLAMLCIACMILSYRYQGQLCEGLAWDMVSAIAQREDGAQILLQCYQAGFSRLEDDLAPAVSLLGQLALTAEVKQQLMYSLRTTLAALLETLIPQVVVAWLLLTAVLTAALPDVVRRRRGKAGYLPPFGEWQLTDTVRRHLNVLVVGYLLMLFTDQPLLVLLASLCAAAFQYAYMVLGLAVMEGVTKQHGTVRFVRRLWMAGCTLFAPFVLVILGVVDRGLDLRKLRRLPDDEGGYGL